MTRKYGGGLCFSNPYGFVGTGLGLVISKKLCVAMGGDLWMDSKENEGSTFSFTIEVSPAEPRDSIPYVIATSFLPTL